ncbi:MAG: UbiA family prenyltransferase [Desulfobacterales bacterium]|jgi:protoheme IX farnesyltransferase
MTVDAISALSSHLFIARTNDWFRLVKLRISLMNAVSALAGYVVFRPYIGWDLIATVSSVFVLACGSAALNNYQDRNRDELFSRTRERPLPKQLISGRYALVMSIILMIIGLGGLLRVHSMGSPVLLGVLAVILYNGVYTPLKSKSVLAILPGSICGMLPPLIGWTAAGGNIYISQIQVLMAAIGLWQLPHFWLIILSGNEEYRHADMPNMLRLFSIDQLNRIMFVWVLAFACVSMVLPMFQLIINSWLKGLLALYLMMLVLFFAHVLFFRHKAPGYSFLFKSLNISMGTVLLVTIADRLFLRM